MPRTRTKAISRIGGRSAYPSLIQPRATRPTTSDWDTKNTTIRFVPFNNQWAILGRTDVIANELQSLGCVYSQSLDAWIAPTQAVKDAVIAYFTM